MPLWKKSTAPADGQGTSAGLSSGATVAPADPSRPQGKGRPTPRRKEAEAANRRPLVVDKKSMTADDKARMRAERGRVREAMMAGEEKYLPARDRGPERRFLRDAVDVRWNVGELLLPIMLVVLALSLLPFDAMRVWSFLAAYGLMLYAVIDCWLLWRRTKKRFVAAFDKEPPKGSAWYVVLRSFQMRMSRVPRPAVERGAELHRR
ncbi:DUF3043 domain-containing protein [Ornithinimicrobium flavum]|uniref:DUF3043 domain-containing protein n=1 Tax=Ornithinimicrobium flavum TaxID=1288636 RepID=UPI0010701051|nr:DUF3043 domain-containing protein [Ornithinimicrobium flavum]